MVSHFVEAPDSDSLMEEKIIPKPRPPPVPQSTFLIVTLLSLLSSIVLLGLSARIVGYDNSSDAKFGRTEVQYSLQANNGTARNETALINNLPEHTDDDSFYLIMAVCVYCIVLFASIVSVVWKPVERYPFLHMTKKAKIASFVLVGLAMIAQFVGAAYALIDDGRSGNVTPANLHRYRNGTYREEFGPASWSCELQNFALDADRRSELGQLCQQGKAVLAFTIVCTFFTSGVLLVMVYFVMALRKRSKSARPVSQELGEEQQGMIRDFFGQ